MNFFNEMEKFNDKNTLQYTENGALGYKTSGKYLLDINFQVASLRSASAFEIIEKFEKAYEEDPVLAMRWLFFARDVRGGLGERNLFRVCMTRLARTNPDMVIELLPYIAEFGRWDDLWSLINIYDKIDDKIFDLVQTQLIKDIVNYQKKESVSLLAKWMPSENASSAQTKALARWFIKRFKCAPKQYRKMLAGLRKYLDVTERKTSGNQWNEINYSAVPSKANLLYKDAFIRHDFARRREYLDALAVGEEKINASVLYPHDIVAKMHHNSYYDFFEDATCEQLWKNLPDYVNGDGTTLVVADGSGSMYTHVGNTNVEAWDVAHALAIYFSERTRGPFANRYITFSNRPQFVRFDKNDSLYEKINTAKRHSEVANTNIEAVFDLILNTAIENDVAQEDLPANILIISDMEFDSATDYDVNATLFEVIGAKYKAAGYRLPRLVFWNVNSRTKTVPIRENKCGVALVSGFSPSICKMVLSNQTDPFEALKECIMDKKYDCIGEVVEKYNRR